MLKLLPKNQKNNIIQEYRMRFWVVACSLFLAGEIISLVLLVPPYLVAKTRVDILNSQSGSLKVQSLNTESSQLSDTVKQTNAYISAFTSSSTPIGVVSAIQNIVGARDKTIRLGSFFYSPINGQLQIVITGNANSRQSLLDFVKKLKNQPGVVSADLPVSDFAKPQDIDFSIRVLMNPQNKI